MTNSNVYKIVGEKAKHLLEVCLFLFLIVSCRDSITLTRIKASPYVTDISESVESPSVLSLVISHIPYGEIFVKQQSGSWFSTPKKTSPRDPFPLLRSSGKNPPRMKSSQPPNPTIAKIKKRIIAPL